ncbi:hypothetical protein [Streptomyces yangpuensis]
MGLALVLGHRWNRLRPAVVYEDVGTAHVYEPAFFVHALPHNPPQVRPVKNGARRHHCDCTKAAWTLSTWDA